MKTKIIGISIFCLLIGASIIPSISGNENGFKQHNESYDINSINLGVFDGAPREEWNKTYGGPRTEYAFNVEQTDDDGYIICGNTNSYGEGQEDIFIVKTDSYGNEIWNKTYGSQYQDYYGFIQQTNDGGYAITGSIRTDRGIPVSLIKTDSEGDIIWDKKYFYGEGYCLRQTSDNGYIISGSGAESPNSYEKLTLIKTDIDGDLIWQKFFGEDSDYNYFSGITVYQTSADNGFITITAGYEYNYEEDNTDAYIIKTDSNGNKEWDLKLGGPFDDYGYSILESSDGSYIFTGVVGSSGRNEDIWLVKLDNDGDIVWEKRYDYSNDDYGYSIDETVDNGFIICGYIKKNGEKSQLFLMKTDSEGNLEWDVDFGGEGDDYGAYVKQTNDQGFIVAGSTKSFSYYNDIWLIKVASEGAPDKPSISGEINGKAGNEYEYTFTTIDPNDDDIYLYIEWGDNETEEWVGNYMSGEEVKIKHTFSEQNTYIIRAKSKDIYDAESDWATLEVSMPKNKPINTPFLRFLENHPYLFPLLQQLLGLQ